MAFKHEEDWVPCSPWGWWRKAENEKYLREQSEIRRTEKPKTAKKRIRVNPNPYVAGNCSMCPGHIGPQNKSGVCSKCCKTHIRRNLKKGPRPICTVCGIAIQRNNTKGLCPAHKSAAFSGMTCSKCDTAIRVDNKSGLCRIHALAGRIIVQVAKPKKPVGRPIGFKLISDRKCAECDAFLRKDNVSGLCAKHSAKFWNAVRAARKKAA